MSKLRIRNLFIVAGFMLAITPCKMFAQTQPEFHAMKGQVNDFAGVLSDTAKQKLETVLANLKLRSKVDFYLATVEDTGGLDIFDYSRQLSRQWNVGVLNGKTRTLLLVVAINSKSSFTQFSRLAQEELPEGVLGEMSQRMRALLASNKVAEAIDDGVQFFVSSLSQKLGFSLNDIDKPAAGESASNGPSAATEQGTASDTNPAPSGEAAPVRPRTVSDRSPAPVAVATDASAGNTEASPSTVKPGRKQPAVNRTAAANRKPSNSSAKKQDTPPVNDDDEAEEVELTLTKPLPERATLLKAFLDSHPNSKARPRALELLISTHAALGDARLRDGDNAAGVEQLRSAIDEADTSVSNKLFTGVIAQIPLNLYLRGERDAAFAAAQSIESKFGADPKRLLSLAGFYLGIERGDEVARLAQQALKLAPDLPEAHRMLALGLHIGLRLNDAAAEYKRALELDASSKEARLSLADLYRGTGRTEDALALYETQLKADEKDKAARTGVILSLLELGRKDEAGSALDSALAEEPRNLQLLTGVAYWYAAHGNFEKALDFAQKAVEIEPRYTWAQIALARALVGLKRPLDAERSIRFAKQYGKFPTLNYELANVLAALGLYEEAVEVLRESFTVKDAQLETRLAGRLAATGSSFTDLLAAERQASIYQPNAADSPANDKSLKDLLLLSLALKPVEGEKVDEARAEASARDFASQTDEMRAFREAYGASRLLQKNVAMPTVVELAVDARKNADIAIATPVATIATQADEYRDLRARAIASGKIPDVAEAPRNLLLSIFQGRLQDIEGWALFNQEKYPEAIDHMKQAATILPEGTPAWRTALWHLGVALEQSGNNEDALNNYIKSYTTGDKDPVRRGVIERLYRKVNGSLSGLDEKIGPADGASTTVSEGSANAAANPPADSTSVAPGATQPTTPAPEKTPAPETASTPDAAKPEVAPAKPVEESARNDNKTPPATEPPAPSGTPAPADARVTAPATPLDDESMRAAAARTRSSIKVAGRVLDANKAGVGNVVVVIISPSGSVLAATTDVEGRFSFTVAASQKAYRVIPSKDGYTFAPMDRTFASLFEDQLNIDFVGTASPTP